MDCFIEKFKTLARDGGNADLNISSRAGGLLVSLSLHLPNIPTRDKPAVKPRRRNKEIPSKARWKANRAAARAEEENIPTFAETTPPLSLAETVEMTPPLPPPQSVKTVDKETQTERDDRESPERKRKKTTATVTEAEIMRDSSGDANASLEITDDEEEQDVGGRDGREVTETNYKEENFKIILSKIEDFESLCVNVSSIAKNW